MLKSTDLTKTYRTGDTALAEVSLEVPKGQVVGLIGSSGAGKSTLIRCINRLLDRVGLLQHADKRADALSGGQGQRVGIARALGQEPELLLVDEPTASLDPKTSRQIMRLLIEIYAERGLPAIVNIHDVPLAQQFMQRIIGLRAGRCV